MWNWLPVPQLFLLTKKDWSSLVIDWQQRLISLIRFILSGDDILKVFSKDDLINENFWSKSFDIKQLKVSKSIFSWDIKDKDIKIWFNELDKETKRKFEWESLIIAQIKPTYSLFIWKEEDLEKLSKEIFYRLNTGWIKLTSQEIRHSLYHKSFMKQIKEISFSDNWKNLIPTWIQKFKNDKSLLWEMILRAFSLLDSYAKENKSDTIWKVFDSKSNKFTYFKPLNLLLDKYASISDKFSDIEIDERIKLLNKLLKILNELFNDWTFFKHQNVSNTKTLETRANTFNIKYVDTLFVWLLNVINGFNNLWLSSVINWKYSRLS